MRRWGREAVVLLLLGAQATGCALTSWGRGTDCHGLRGAYASLSPEQIQVEMQWVETALAEGAPRAAPELHLRLAFLLLHHASPSSDPTRALEQLEAYAVSDPDGLSCPEVPDWIHNLGALLAAAKRADEQARRIAILEQEKRRLEAEAQSLRAENRLLRSESDAARESESDLRDQLHGTRLDLERARKRGEETARENARLRDSIDKLQYLDFQMEQKRRAMK